MTLSTLWWMILAVTLGLLAYNIAAARKRRARGESTPAYAAGNVPGALGIMAMCGANLVGLETRLGVLMLAASFVFLACDVALFVRANRAGRSSSRHVL